MPKVRPLGVTPEQEMDERFRLWTRNFLAGEDARNKNVLCSVYKVSTSSANNRYNNPGALRLSEFRRAAKYMTDEEILGFVRKQ